MRLAAPLALLALALAAPARADDRPPLRENKFSWWIPVGAGVGVGGFAGGATAGVLGIEVSVVRYHPHDVPEISGRLGDTITTPWVGGYVDAAYVDYDDGPDRKRLTLGPEVGWGVLGLDGGLALDFGGEDTQAGVALRAIFAPPGVIMYARVVELPGQSLTPWIEGGLLFKLPIPVR